MIVPLGDYSTVKACGSPEAESPATHSWNSPGSTSYFMLRVQNARSATGISKRRCFVSPAAKATRSKRFNSLTGLTTEPTRSRV